MQLTVKTLIAAALTCAALSLSAGSASAQTSGPGDRVLANMAMDRDYNCARNDAGTCLAALAPQMPDIPGMPSAGEGGASSSNHEISRPDMPGDLKAQPIASATHDLSARLENGDNVILTAIIAACIAGIAFLIGQFVRLARHR